MEKHSREPSRPKQPYACPAELTASLIGGKWKVILIYNLRRGPLRFGELKRRSQGITPATLTGQLRELEAARLIEQAWVGQERTEGVEYGLTERGQSLKPIVYAMIRWGLKHQRDYVAGDFEMANFVTKIKRQAGYPPAAE